MVRRSWYALTDAAIPAGIGSLCWCLLTASPVSASDWDDCRSQNAGLRIASCTAIIDARTEKTEGLAEAYALRAVAHDNLDAFDKALADFAKSIELAPKNIFAYNNRGIAYFMRGDCQHAIRDYDTVVRLEPEFAPAYVDRGACRYMLGELDLALKDYDTALSIRPDYADALNNRGLVHADQGNTDRAIEDFTASLRVDSRNAEALLNRGHSYLGIGDNTKALKDYDAALRINPVSAKAYNGKGMVKFNTGKYSQAIKHFDEAIRLDPNYVSAYTRRGLSLSKLKKYEKAIADHSKAIQLDPDNVEAFENRASTYLLTEKLAAAIADLTEVIRLQPESAKAYVGRSDAYALSGDKSRALADYEKAMSLDAAAGIMAVAAIDPSITGLNPPLPANFEIAELDDQNLGFSYLSTVDMLEFSLGPIYGAWAKVHKEGGKFSENVVHVSRNPDGSEQTNKFKTFEEFDRYIQKILGLQRAFIASIKERGFHKLPEGYSTAFGKQCSKTWPKDGNASLEVHDFLFLMRQEDKAFIGASVQNAIVIVVPLGYEAPLFGKISNGKIRLTATSGKCTLTMTPVKG